MPRYRVFIAYGGETAKTVACDMAECVWSKGMKPYIAADGCRGSISAGSQELIFRIEKDCHAVLAVNTDESYDSQKFRDEVEKARYGPPPLPVVAFVQEGGRVLELLGVGCVRVRFQGGQHMQKCQAVADRLREQVRFTRGSTNVPENMEIPRSRPI